MPDARTNPTLSQSLDKQLDEATEELITGDSDDPPLSEEAIVEMIKASRASRGLSA
jgi:hypothetical protein